MSLETPLSDPQQKILRAQRTISDNEVAVKVGDIFVAQNVVTGVRRQINVVFPSMTESKKLLKD